MSLNFNDDLKEGKKAEREFASRLVKWGAIKVELSEWDVPWWDIKATFLWQGQTYEKSFEVKKDRYAENSEQVCVEYCYKWEPSWIYTSNADYIVYNIGDKFYYADRLRFIIDVSKAQKVDLVWGDGNNSNIWLVDREYFNSITNEL